MSLGTPVKVIGKPPTVILSDDLQARVTAVLRRVAARRPRVAGPERIDPAIIWAGPPGS